MQQQVDTKSDKHAATGRYKTWQHIASRYKTGQTCDRWIKQGDRSEVVYKARRQPTLAGVGWAACGLPLCRRHCWRAHRRRAAKPFSWLSSSLVTPVTRPEVVRIGRSPFGTSLKLLNGATLVVQHCCRLLNKLLLGLKHVKRVKRTSFSKKKLLLLTS